MHGTAEDVMRNFVKDYLLEHNDKELTILDVGSYDINGTYRPLMIDPKGRFGQKWKYTGADIMAGPNVDIVIPHPYDWKIPTQYDVFVSGNTMEHVEDLKLWVGEITKVTKPGGLVFLDGPFRHGFHRYPLDCWRIVPDGMKWLLDKVCGFDVLYCDLVNDDCVGIARKPF